MPQSEQSFWGHLEVLRWVIVRCLAVLMAVAVAAFVLKEWLFDGVVLAPLSADFATYRGLCWLGTKLHWPALCLDVQPIELINIHLASQFFIHLEMAGVAALIVVFPYLTLELWFFVKPALYQRERGAAVTGAVSFVLLFFLGVAVSYFIIFPLTLNFLGNYQVSAAVENQIALSSYVSTFLTLCLLMGVTFEMPVAAYFFARIGVLKSGWLRQYRKVAIVAMLVQAAVITPSGDAFTMMLVVIPLLGLYELSRLVVQRVERRATR